MKSFDAHVAGILFITLILALVLTSERMLGGLPSANGWNGWMFLAMLVIPQGRIFSRLGDLKKFGQSIWSRIKYFFVNQIIVFVTLVIFTIIKNQ